MKYIVEFIYVPEAAAAPKELMELSIVDCSRREAATEFATEHGDYVLQRYLALRGGRSGLGENFDFTVTPLQTWHKQRMQVTRLIRQGNAEDLESQVLPGLPGQEGVSIEGDTGEPADQDVEVGLVLESEPNLDDMPAGVLLLEEGRR